MSLSQFSDENAKNTSSSYKGKKLLISVAQKVLEITRGKKRILKSEVTRRKDNLGIDSEYDNCRISRKKTIFKYNGITIAA